MLNLYTYLYLIQVLNVIIQKWYWILNSYFLVLALDEWKYKLKLTFEQYTHIHIHILSIFKIQTGLYKYIFRRIFALNKILSIVWWGYVSLYCKQSWCWLLKDIKQNPSTHTYKGIFCVFALNRCTYVRNCI